MGRIVKKNQKDILLFYFTVYSFPYKEYNRKEPIFTGKEDPAVVKAQRRSFTSIWLSPTCAISVRN